MSEQHTFYLHYWPQRPIYVCLRDSTKRPFDFKQGAFRPTAELQDLSHACLRATEKAEWRADYDCSYSVSVDLAPMKAHDDHSTGLKDGDHFEVFWIVQTGDSPSPNQDKIVGSGCRMNLTDGRFSPADPRSAEMLDESLLFAKRESRRQEAAKFREAEQQWVDAAYERRDRAVQAADIGEVLRVLAWDLCRWGDNLKHHLFDHCNQHCDDELCRSFRAHCDNAPVPLEIHVPWVIRELVGLHEAYDMLEFHKSREYARGFSQRCDALHQERLMFSRKIVEYTSQFGRDLVFEPFLVLDELRKDLRVHARQLADHLMLVADQFPKSAESQAGYVDEPAGDDRPEPLEQEQPYSLTPPNLFQWKHDPPVELTPRQWSLLSYCLDNRRATVQEVADHLWNDGTASDKTEAAIDSLKSKLNTRLAEADIPVSVSRKTGFLVLSIDA